MLPARPPFMPLLRRLDAIGVDLHRDGDPAVWKPGHIAAISRVFAAVTPDRSTVRLTYHDPEAIRVALR